jgi:hypothetical protein
MQKIANNQIENTIEMHVIIRIVWSDELVIVPLLSSTNGEKDNPMMEMFLNDDTLYWRETIVK